MTSVVEPSINPLTANVPIVDKYELTLNQAIQNVVAEIHEENPNLAQHIDVFYNLMQSQIDPPLETIWVFSALSFRSREITSNDLSDRVLIIKELFQLISGCSGPCGPSKSIALLAPIAFQVYKLVAELLLGTELGAKRVKKLTKEVKFFVGSILGYASVRSCKDLNEERDSHLIAPFADLVGVWLNEGGRLESFLPLVSNEIFRDVSVGKCSVNYLAGVVITEMLLLKLCLDLRTGNRGVELERDLRSWVVGSVTASQNFYLHDTLVNMLLEKILPVTLLQSSEDEVFLRKILYDAAILAEYTFLSPQRTMYLPAPHVKSLALKRLIITHEAIEFSRKIGDQKKAVSYTRSFSDSQLFSQVIKMVTSQIGTAAAASKLNGSSPKALINSLLVLEDQGLRIFYDSISKYRAKLALGNYTTDYDQPSYEPETKSADPDILFYIDNKGEGEGDNDDAEKNESASVAFVAAAKTMRLLENGGRKRRGGHAGKKRRTKLLKHDLSDSSDSDRASYSSISDDASSSGSEVENPSSDENV